MAHETGDEDFERPPGSGAPEEQRERHGIDADMLAPFIVYIAVIVAGLALAITIGLTHG